MDEIVAAAWAESFGLSNAKQVTAPGENRFSFFVLTKIAKWRPNANRLIFH